MRRLFTIVCACALCSLAACGGSPEPVEVTETWSSGDEEALGIQERGIEPDAPTGAAGPTGAPTDAAAAPAPAH